MVKSHRNHTDSFRGPLAAGRQSGNHFTPGDKHIMEEVDSAKYLGDIIQTDGKNKRNIQERKNRGLGAVNQVQQLLDDLCLGDYHFEAANILRNSLLLSSLVSNSETWYNVT